MEQRRTIVAEVRQTVERSERCVCRWLGLDRNAVRYTSTRPKAGPLRRRLRELAAQHPRWGSPMLICRLRREGWTDNHKRIRRLYRLEGLAVRRPRRKRAAVAHVPAVAAAQPKEIWAMDFVRALQALALTRGLPRTISVDNGPEFHSRVLDAWVREAGVTLQFSRPGKPVDHTFIEAFNGRLRDKCLNQSCFRTLADAQFQIERWRVQYNTNRPHRALGGLTPRSGRRSITLVPSPDCQLKTGPETGLPARVISGLVGHRDSAIHLSVPCHALLRHLVEKVWWSLDNSRAQCSRPLACRQGGLAYQDFRGCGGPARASSGAAFISAATVPLMQRSTPPSVGATRRL
jgi:putative transposase